MAMPLLMAESISQGAKDLLKAEQVGYFDSGGSLYLPAVGAYIFIDRPLPKAFGAVVRSLFSGRRAQVLQTLLLEHRTWFGVKVLAERSQVSKATASQVLSELDRFEWTRTRGLGPNKERMLQEPAALLDAWVNQVTSARPVALRRYYVPGLKADTLVGRLGQVCASHEVDYAITHEAAAQRYAPFLTNISQVRCRMLSGPKAEDAIQALRARGVSEGANLAIIEAAGPGDLLFRDQVEGIWLASPIQVYLDLLSGEGRAKEMAGHLRRERIGF
jgi:hypothetical protein